MRVKYQTRMVRANLSTNGGTSAELGEFVRRVFATLIEMGAPLDTDTYHDYNLRWDISFTGEIDGESGGAGLFLEYTKNDNGDFEISIAAYGRDLTGTHMNYAELYTRLVSGSSTSRIVSVTIHAVKSGDSFFFGFLPVNSNSSNGCIAIAITPMRRLSDPSENLGYALVEGTSPAGPDEFIGGMICRTLPYIEGFNYNGGMFNFTTPGYVHAFPEVDTGKIPLIPYYAGMEDIYYDKVYISPMKRGTHEEKAFETDKGVFLIGGEPGIDHTQELYNTLAFDITEAVESAQ